MWPGTTRRRPVKLSTATLATICWFVLICCALADMYAVVLGYRFAGFFPSAAAGVIAGLSAFLVPRKRR
jgi:hypothetical protein